MKILITSDIHLEMVNSIKLNNFIEEINKENPDILLIAGDISTSTYLVKYLFFLDKKINCEIFFVLGNHDFYEDSISNTKVKVKEFVSKKSKIKYLTDDFNFIYKDKSLALIGIDGWADGLNGDYKLSNVMLNDYMQIFDFLSLDKNKRFLKLKELGKFYSDLLQKKLNDIPDFIENIFILTHVPPFKESCVYNNMPTNDNFLPHFSCKQVGDLILKYSDQNKNKNIFIFCGHTHEYFEVQISKKIKVLTMGSQYGNPKIQKIIEV